MPETQLSEITIPGREDFVAIARAGVKTLLKGAPKNITGDAVAIVGEFVANAVLWSRSGLGGQVSILIDYEPGSDTARIQVTDEGALSDEEKAVRQRARGAEDYGEQYQRGLEIVAALAKDWGKRSSASRGTYWAVLSWT
jgi:anti-sigma regulatory factor (Ser/Thr protein kinase)